MTKPKKIASSSGKKTSAPKAGSKSPGGEGRSPTPSPLGKAAKAVASKAALSPQKPSGASKPPPVVPAKGASSGAGGGGAGKGPAKSSVPARLPVPAGGKSTESRAPAASGAKAKVKAPEAAPVPEAPIVPRKLPKGGPGKADLKRYRDLLITMRRDLLASSRDLEAEVLKSSGAEFSVDHMADNGSDNYEQDFSLKLLEGEGEQLAEIRDALLKIDGKLDPPFGVCEPCVDEDQKLCPTCPYIPSARLDAMPHARMCVQTKELDEKRRG